MNLASLKSQTHILTSSKLVKVKIKCTAGEGCVLKHFS